jgi:alkylhydroperoxidase family enzyme
VEVEKELAAGEGPWDASMDIAAFVHALERDYKQAPWPSSTLALLEYADRLTRAPASCRPEHLDVLRGQGFDDRAIHDATQVIAYFNYINRVADGLGIDLEPGMAPTPPWS